MSRIVGPENYTYDDFGKGVQIESLRTVARFTAQYRPGRRTR
jgi:hypothetical protein